MSQTTAPTTTAAPELAYDFDHNDDWCSRGIDAAIDDAPADLRDELRTIRDRDPHRYSQSANEMEAVNVLNAAAEAAADADDFDRQLACEAAAAILQPCDYQCECTGDAWSVIKDALDGELGRIGARTWAVLHNGETDSDIVGELSYDDLTRWAPRTWDRFSAVWAGRNLTVNFGGADTVLTALDDEQCKRLDRWYDLLPPFSGGDSAATIAAGDPEHLDTAFAVHDALTAAEYETDIEIVFAAVKTLNLRTVSPADLAIIAGVSNGWDGTVTDLLSIPADLTYDLVAA
jgi:hypothetical protein